MSKMGVIKNKLQKRPINKDPMINNTKIITLIIIVNILTNGIGDTDNDNKQAIRNIAHNITCAITDNAVSAANNIGNKKSGTVNGNNIKTKHNTKNNIMLSDDPIKIEISEQINPSGVKIMLPSIVPIIEQIMNGGETPEINRHITIIADGITEEIIHKTV
jgi:hypothetical protein